MNRHLLADFTRAVRLPCFDGSIASGIADGWMRYLARRRRKATIHSLQALDDRTLGDIGLDRSEIESVIESRIGERRHRVIDFGRGYEN